jgi:hypothetical protein
MFQSSKNPLEPNQIITKALEIRKENGGQSAVNNLLERSYIAVKEHSRTLTAGMADQYAQVFEKLGGGEFRHHASKIREEASNNQSITDKAEKWLRSGDTGASSRAIWRKLTAMPIRQTEDYPHDMDDFGRCVRLMDAVPEWRERIPELGGISVRWKAIAENWDKLEAAQKHGDYQEGTHLLREIMNAAIDSRTSLFSPEAASRREAVASLLSETKRLSLDNSPDKNVHFHTSHLPLSHGLDLANDIAEALRASKLFGFSVMVSDRNSVFTAGALPFGERAKSPEAAAKGYFHKLSPSDFRGNSDVQISINFQKNLVPEIKRFVDELLAA